MTIRIAMLLLCLPLAACAGGKLPGADDTVWPISSYFPSLMSAPTGETADAVDPPEGSAADRAQKVRAQCWMQVEHEKNLRGIDQRVAYVDRCVSAQIRI